MENTKMTIEPPLFWAVAKICVASNSGCSTSVSGRVNPCFGGDKIKKTWPHPFYGQEATEPHHIKYLSKILPLPQHFLIKFR